MQRCTVLKKAHARALAVKALERFIGARQQKRCCVEGQLAVFKGNMLCLRATCCVSSLSPPLSQAEGNSHLHGHISLALTHEKFIGNQEVTEGR